MIKLMFLIGAFLRLIDLFDYLSEGPLNMVELLSNGIPLSSSIVQRKQKINNSGQCYISILIKVSLDNTCYFICIQYLLLYIPYSLGKAIHTKFPIKLMVLKMESLEMLMVIIDEYDQTIS